ncbi:MAG: arginine N-succinyltransferase [Archangiaceae bacterium]|nr:arginine N-succinyltransferase [Archangiaceae bacterium]
MLLLRDVQKNDLTGLKRLAAVLNSVNLPNNEEVLSSLIERSTKSFSGTLRDPFHREYLFVLEDLRNKQLIGTSMIIAQHGTREAPHIAFQVTEAEHYSASIDKHIRHQVLSIGYNYEGPTEIGGLVVDPPHRSTPEKPGKQLSYVRFLYMAMHKKLFRPRVLAELLPPLMKDGRSLLWEACGKKFTGLEYPEADKLSRRNKEFIKELFPASDIYATLFSTAAQKIIGVVGEETRGVQRMLERIGFKYVNRIDPFDGGPHYEADLSDVTLVRRFRTAKLGEKDFDQEAELYLVAVERTTGKGRFRAVLAPVRFDDKIAYLSESAKEVLGVEPGEKVSLVPFE